MHRHSVRLPIAAVSLVALLASARLSAPAVAAPAGARLSVSLKATYPSPVFADTSEPVKLDAAASRLPKSDHIVVGVWNGKKFTNRDAKCGGGASSCTATDAGGTDGTFTLKAAVVDKRNKILAKSGSIVVHRSMHTLTMDVSDKAGTLAGGGKQLSGVTTTFTIHAAAGAPSSWASVGLYSKQPGSSTWTLVGQLCTIGVTAFDCVRTDAQQYDPARGDKPVAYAVQALDLRGTVALATAARTITWTVWPIQVSVNGALLPKATTPKGDAIEVGRDQQAVIQVTSEVKSLRLGDQQFHVVVVEKPANSSDLVAADCTELPCNATDAVPDTTCGTCDQAFDVLVTDKPYASSGNTVLGNAHVALSWRLPGYQFSGLTLDYTWTRTTQCNRDPMDFKGCTPDPAISVHDTLSGFVCGDAYTNPWTINVDYSNTGYSTQFSNQYTVDATTGLFNPQATYAGQLAPAPEHILVPYVMLYLRSVPGLKGGNMPNQMELTLNAASSVVVIPVPNSSGLTEQLSVAPQNQTNRAPVTTKDDCP
jgi:hypothetical protein